MSGVAGYSESTPGESEALNRSQPNDGIFEEDSPEERPVRERISALDAFRGLTIAGMLLVNNPGTWSAIYPPLQHAPWHGWTPTDLIFPFFLFIVGVTTHLSLAAMVQQGASARTVTIRIIRRGGLIILLGLLLHAFPYVPLTRITEIRIPGVLQRIGLCYLATALLSRGRSSRAIAAVVGLLLLGYWALQTLAAPPGVTAPTIDVPGETLSAWIDRTVFGSHLWKESRTWDPEGLLSTIPAIGTCLLGVLAGRWLTRPVPFAECLNGLFAVGALGMVVVVALLMVVSGLGKGTDGGQGTLFDPLRVGPVEASATRIDLGRVPLDRWVNPTFHLRNLGTEPVAITIPRQGVETLEGC